MAPNPETRKWVVQVFEQLISNRPRSIRRLSVESLNANLSLIRLLANELRLDDARSIRRTRKEIGGFRLGLATRTMEEDDICSNSGLLWDRRGTGK